MNRPCYNGCELNSIRGEVKANNNFEAPCHTRQCTTLQLMPLIIVLWLQIICITFRMDHLTILLDMSQFIHLMRVQQALLQLLVWMSSRKSFILVVEEIWQLAPILLVSDFLSNMQIIVCFNSFCDLLIFFNMYKCNFLVLYVHPFCQNYFYFQMYCRK